MANRRPSRDDYEVRAQFLIDYATEHEPVTVRQLYYPAESAKVPGIGKDELDYRRVQDQVLKLRRSGRLDSNTVADLIPRWRWTYPFNSIRETVASIADRHRLNPWKDHEVLVEVWLDNDALAGTLEPITEELDVPLMVYRGFAAETFAWDAIQFHREREERRKIIVLHLGDFDRSGEDARNDLGNADPSLRKPTKDSSAGSPVKIGRLIEFGREFGVRMQFRHLAVTLDQNSLDRRRNRYPDPLLCETRAEARHRI